MNRDNEVKLKHQFNILMHMGKINIKLGRQEKHQFVGANPVQVDLVAQVSGWEHRYSANEHFLSAWSGPGPSWTAQLHQHTHFSPLQSAADICLSSFCDPGPRLVPGSQSEQN